MSDDVKKTRNQAYYEAHKDKVKARVQRYKDENRERVRADNAMYMRERRATSQDKQFQYRDEQRRRFAKLLNPMVKFTPPILEMASWVGTPPAKLRDYLKAQFPAGSGWDWSNYGKVWSIDHKRPTVLFDLTDPEQCKECWHYTNLQPLDKKENILKGANYDTSEEP